MGAKKRQSPPVQFKKYKKNAGSSGVMALLEQVITDSKNVEAEAVEGEAKAQKDYEDFVQTSNRVLSDLNGAVKMKSEMLANAQIDSEQASSAHKSTLNELEDLADFKADLHGQCDFLLKNFDIR